MRLNPFDAADPAIVRTITRLWNAACGQDLSISERLVRFNLNAATGVEATGCMAQQGGVTVGFILASATTGPVDGRPHAVGCHSTGWVDALAVLPGAQGQGVGNRLLSWAETWLTQHGCTHLRLGGGLRPFVPGQPVQLDRAAFFRNRGYAPRPESSQVTDVARSLAGYSQPAFLRGAPLDVRPLQAQEVALLDAFLSRQFPGRWRFEFQEHLRQGGRLADYLALWDHAQIHGFCQVTLEDSLRPIERFYPHGLPHPWGQLGPIGVSADRRRQGLGSGLLDAGLRYLRTLGVAGCVIDWVASPAFYQKFGFQPHNEYLVLTKELV